MSTRVIAVLSLVIAVGSLLLTLTVNRNLRVENQNVRDEVSSLRADNRMLVELANETYQHLEACRGTSRMPRTQ